MTEIEKRYLELKTVYDRLEKHQKSVLKDYRDGRMDPVIQWKQLDELSKVTFDMSTALNCLGQHFRR